MSEGFSVDYVKSLTPEQLAAKLTEIDNRRIEASNRALELANARAWRSIKTAPKDGTFILVATAGCSCPVIARWNGGRKNSVTDEPLEDGWGDELATHCLPGLNMPTDWMPLPEPPKVQP